MLLQKELFSLQNEINFSCKSDESDSENTLLMDELLELCSWWEESEGEF